MMAGVAGNAEGGYQAGMGVACGDLDGDGRPDLMVTNFYGEGTTLYRNLGQGSSPTAAPPRASGSPPATCWASASRFFDANNDGRPDVMTANGHVNDLAALYRYAMPTRLYEGRPDGRLVDISHQAGPPWDVPRVGRGLAAGDLDNDGRCDALVVAQDGPLAYFHNRTRQAGRFVTLRLEGPTSNRDGVGPWSPSRPAARRQVAQRVGGGSYLSAYDPRLHFGLGPSDRVERGRGPLAVGPDRPLAVPPRRNRVFLARRRSDAPSPGGIRGAPPRRETIQLRNRLDHSRQILFQPIDRSRKIESLKNGGWQG